MRRVIIVFACVLFLGACFVAVTGWYPIITVTSSTVIIGPSTNPPYICVYALSQQESETHPVAIVGPDGDAWYREEVSGLTIECIGGPGIYAATVPEQGVTLFLQVLPPCQDEFRAWSQSRIGRTIGVVFGEQLVHTEVLHSELAKLLTIPANRSLEDAQEWAKEIEEDNQAARWITMEREPDH